MRYLFLILISFNSFAICENLKVTTDQGISYNRHVEKCKCNHVLENFLAKKKNLSHATKRALQKGMADLNSTLLNCSDLPFVINEINGITPSASISQADIDEAIGFLQ